MARNTKSSSALWLLFSPYTRNSGLKSPSSPPLALALATAFLGSTMVLTSLRAQEKTAPMSMDQQMHHHHGDVPLVTPVYPRLGRAQENAGGALVTLEQAQKLAEETNPTLRQAEAEIRAARARQQQIGLYPNPSVGYAGDEIRGGSVGGGKQGFFVQQTIVTA